MNNIDNDSEEKPFDLLLNAEVAPPMANGEVLFEAPWQGRVFGMARSLEEAGLYTWDEFREQLIKHIGQWDRRAEGSDESEGSEYAYYDHFLAALESVLADKALLEPAAVQVRFGEFLKRPHGHDHGHDDGHHHHD